LPYLAVSYHHASLITAAKAPASPYIATMNLELTDEEAAALTRYLRQAFDAERSFLAPRLAPIKAVLAKHDPPPPRPEPLPPLPPASAGSRLGPGRRRGT
jgi:hypothetical protein